jgi:hypothetical protein
MGGPDTTAGGEIETAAEHIPFGDPQTSGQEYLHAGVRGVTGAAPFGVPGGARALATTALSGASSGLSSDFARQHGFGRGVQIAAGILGGLIPGGASLRVLARNAPEAALPEASTTAPPPIPRGPMATIARLTGTDRTVGARLVAQRLHDDGINPYDAGRVISEAQANGTPAVLADLGENTRALASSVSRQAGPARTIAKGFTKERQMGQMDRVRDAINRDLGPTTDILSESDRLLQQARERAGPLYDQAYATPVPASPRLQAILATPAGRAALARARTIAANEGKDPTEMGLLLDEKGEVVLQPGNPLSFTESQRANPVTQRAIQPGGSLGRAPARPPTFADALKTKLEGETAAKGMPVRIDAEEAIDKGVPADVVYFNANVADKSKLRLRFPSIFGTRYGKMTGKQQHLISLDMDDVDPVGWGFDHKVGQRLDPEEIGDLLGRSLQGDASALERGPAFEAWTAHQEAQARRAEFEGRFPNGPPVERVGSPATLADLRASDAPPDIGRLPALGPNYRTETLDYVKRGLDDIIEQNRNPITGKLDLDESGRAVNGLKNRLLDEMDRLNPHYRSARQAYAGPAALNSAMRDGKRPSTNPHPRSTSGSRT